MTSMDRGILHKAVFFGKSLHDILGKEIEKVFVRHYNEDKEQEKRLAFFTGGMIWQPK